MSSSPSITKPALEIEHAMLIVTFFLAQSDRRPDIPAKWQVLQSIVVNARSAENIFKVTRGTTLIEMCSRRCTSQVIPPFARGILMASLGPCEKQREAFKLQANTPATSLLARRPTFSRTALARPPPLALCSLYVFARDFNFNASRCPTQLCGAAAAL